jgi:hypothetical protein
MDFIANGLCINYAQYSTFGKQVKAMLDAIEQLYQQYQATDERVIVTKKIINELVEKAKADIEDEQPGKLKQMVINLAQFEALLNHVLNPINKSVSIQESALNDTYTFEVYTGRMKSFLDFLKEMPTIALTSMKKDGAYVYLTLTNSGRFEAWEPVVRFYKEKIKI